MMDVHKVSDNFYGVEDRKIISPHHSHPTNGASDSINALEQLDQNAKKTFNATRKAYGVEYHV